MAIYVKDRFTVSVINSASLYKCFEYFALSVCL